jgi:hypothetical protein
MFSWLVSLLLLFSWNGRVSNVPQTGPSDHGNRHVSTADNPQPGPGDPADPDGTGSKG